MSARLLIFALVALAQLSVPAHQVWMRTQTLKNGRVWKFQTAPVDPVDAFRGRYVSLQFKAEEVPLKQRYESGDTAYAILKEGADGFAEVERLSPTPEPGDNVMKVRLNGGWYENPQNIKVQRVDFPFDKYWVSEDIAPAAEQAYRDNSNRKKMNAYVTVRVRPGDAAIEELYLDNQPLKEYLRKPPPPKP